MGGVIVIEKYFEELGYKKKKIIDDENFSYYITFSKNNDNIEYDAAAIKDDKVQLRIWAFNKKNFRAYYQTVFVDETDIFEILLQMEKNIKTMIGE